MKYGGEKTFADILRLYKLNMFSQVLKNGFLPQTLNKGVIALMMKKVKDLEEVGGYRRTSLLHLDQKILAKALANRLKSSYNQIYPW